MKRKSARKITDFEIFSLIDQGYTQRKISNILGISPQALNKRFKRYKKDGLIRVSETATKDMRSLTLGHDTIYVVTEKGRANILGGFHRKSSDEFENCINAIIYYAHRIRKLNSYQRQNRQ